MKAEGTSTKKKAAKPKSRVGGSDADEHSASAKSSEPSTDRESSASAGLETAPKAAPAERGTATVARDSELDDDRRMAQVGLGAAALVVTGAIVSGLIFGPATAVLVLAAGAFIAVISLFWSSLRTLLGETPLSGADAYAIGAPRAEEEQKRAVLRALKDLEFERSVGKISEEDYRRLVSHYRDQAKRLLRLLDEEAKPLRDRAEELVQVRMQDAGLAPKVAHRRSEPLEAGPVNELGEAALNGETRFSESEVAPGESSISGGETDDGSVDADEAESAVKIEAAAKEASRE